MAPPRLLAIANSTDFAVTLFDPDTLEKKNTIEVSRGPQDLAFSPDGKMLYIAGTLQGHLFFYDVESQKIVEKLELDRKPRRVIVDPDNGNIYVLIALAASLEGGEVLVIDPKQRKVIKQIPVDESPQAIAQGYNNKYLVVATFDNSMIEIIDRDSLEVIKRFSSETGMGLAVHPTKPLAYSTASFDDEIHVIDLESGEITKTITGGQWPTYPELSSDGRYLYIPHEESDSLVKLDTETYKVLEKIAVGQEPIEVLVYNR